MRILKICHLCYCLLLPLNILSCIYPFFLFVCFHFLKLEEELTCCFMVPVGICYAYISVENISPVEFALITLTTIQ